MDADAKRHGHGNCNLLEDDLLVVESREISRIGTTHSIVVVTLLLRFIDLCCVLVIVYYFYFLLKGLIYIE